MRDVKKRKYGEKDEKKINPLSNPRDREKKSWVEEYGEQD
jgi:hypothetical protein